MLTAITEGEEVMDFSSDEMKPMRIFMPYAVEESERLQASQLRLVHYTSAEAAVSIIRNKAFYLRRTDAMNDIAEVWHGYRCVASAMRTPSGKRFKDGLTMVSDGVFRQLNALWESWETTVLSRTYVGCFSKEIPREAEFGRLSMWRAYGQAAGVALFIPSRFFLEPNEYLNAYSSPVAYMSPEEVEDQLSAVAQNIEDNQAYLKSLPPDDVVGWAFAMLRSAIVCTKHMGFREETEWRIVHTQSLDDGPLLPSSVVLRGTPQPVVKLPLVNTLEEPAGTDLSEILSHIVIGPAASQTLIKEALVMELEAAGVQNAASRITSSDIPLRHTIG